MPSAAAGLCAVGVFALGGFLEREQQRQQQEMHPLQEWEEQLGLADGD